MCVWKLIVPICWMSPIKHTRVSSSNSLSIASLVHHRIWVVSQWFAHCKHWLIRSKKAPGNVNLVLSYMKTLMPCQLLLPYPRRSANLLHHWMSESRRSQIIPFPKATLNRRKNSQFMTTRCHKSSIISASQEQFALKSLTNSSVKRLAFTS